jgi:hypothetical protein
MHTSMIKKPYPPTMDIYIDDIVCRYHCPVVGDLSFVAGA